MSWINTMLQTILHKINDVLQGQADADKKLESILQQNSRILAQNDDILASNKELSTGVDKILAYLTPPPPVLFNVEVFTIGENKMAKLAKFGKMKITVLDNGTAKAVATPVDSVGINTVLPDGSSTPAWSASDPGVTISPDPSDTSGLTAIFGPATPPVLVASFTVSVDSVLPDGTTHVSGTSEDNSIIAGGPTGFTVKVS